MNKRIKELAEQATSYKWDGYGEEEIEVIDAEKFAELIVKECATWIELQDDAEHPTAWLLSEELKEHFGVE